MKKRLVITAGLMFLGCNCAYSYDYVGASFNLLNNILNHTTNTNTYSNPVNYSSSNYSGTLGSINSSLDGINSRFMTSYDCLTSILLNSQDYQSLKAKMDIIRGDMSLTQAEREARISQVLQETDALLQQQLQTGEINARMQELSEAKRQEYYNAYGNLLLASKDYAELALSCTNTALSIANDPTRAIEMAFELQQLRYTGSAIKQQSKSIKNIIAQVNEINKANNIEVDTSRTRRGRIKNVETTDW